MSCVSVLEFGSKVKIDGGIEATITAVTLRPSGTGVHVAYEVGWWDSRTYHSEWFPVNMLTPLGADVITRPIGFGG